MSITNKYRIYCNIENGWVEGYGETPPTVCYNNNEHEVNPNSVQELSDVSKNLTYSIKRDEILSSTFVINDKFIFKGAAFCKIYSVSHMDSGVTSYSIKIYDKTKGKIIIEKTLNNTNEDLQELGIGNNISTDKAVWEIQAKKIGGNKNQNAYINSIYIEYD